MDNGKLNCWEYQGCGRGPNGPRAREGGQCPASKADSLNGANGGKSGGRACWAVEGTLCDGMVAGPYERKIHVCRKCAFYARVQVEERLNVVPDEELLSRLL